VPALLKSDDTWQMAIETDRTTSGTAASYLAWRPESVGSAVFVPSVHGLHIRIGQALKLNRALGRGSELIAAEVEAFQS